MAIAIALGALGAHKLASMLDVQQLASFKTGVFYQIVHAIGLLAIIPVIKSHSNKLLKMAINCLKIGPILFSGSIYLLSTADITGLQSIKKVLGPITPIGGLIMITGWIILAIVVSKMNFSQES